MIFRILALLTLLALLAAAGCWSRVEINHIAFVMAVGIDRGSEAEPVRLTVQIAVPRSSAMQQGGSGESPVWLATADGRSVQDALQKLVSRSSRQLSLAHLQVLVIGDDLAREGVGPVIDFFDRNRQSLRTILILISQGEARTVLEAKVGIGRIPGAGLRRAYFLKNRSNEYYADEFGRFLYDLHTGRSDPVAGRVVVTRGQDGQFEAELSRAAVFRRDRLAAFLTPEETEGLLLILGKSRQMPISVDTGRESPMTVIISDLNSRLIPGPESEPRRMRIVLRGEGELIEISEPFDARRPENITRIERLVETSIRRRIERTASRSQEIGSDFLGYGHHFYRFRPQAWSKAAGRWDRVFPQIETKVEVRFHLRKTGLSEGSVTGPVDPPIRPRKDVQPRQEGEES